MNKMDIDISNAAHLSGSYRNPQTRAMMFGATFVLVWPALIVLCVSVMVSRAGHLTDGILAIIVLRIYSVFWIAFLLIQVMQKLFPVVFAEDRFWRQLALHLGALALVSQLSARLISDIQPDQASPLVIIPSLLVLLQVGLFVATKTLIFQREQHLATQLYLKQAQVNLLRSQSSPHFLFNTLNLLASEVDQNPAKAKDIIYDLSDLLRESMLAADTEFISVAEEVRLADLYLALQTKRFPERLQYDITVDRDANNLQIPSLILQPVVENVIKHVVAHSTKMTALTLEVGLSAHELVMTVKDTGQIENSGELREGHGLSIVRETLKLHYKHQAELTIRSTDAGTEVSITIPSRLLSGAT